MNDIKQHIRAMRSVKRSIKPDAAWLKNTRDILKMQIKNSLPTEQAPAVEKIGVAWQALATSRISRFIRKPIMTTISIFSILTSCSILSVSAAESSLPGDFFYGLKLVTEQARLVLTGPKEDKLFLKTQFTERRVSELKEMVNNQATKEAVGAVAEVIKRDLKTMKDQLVEVKNEASSEKVVAAAKMVDKKTSEVITALQETKTQLSPETKEKVNEAQSAAAETTIKAIEVLAEKHQESPDSVAAAELTTAIQEHAKLVVEVTSTGMPLLNSTSSATGTVSTLPDVFTSSTAVVTSSTLPALVSEVKDLTTQAFAMQKAQALVEAASSTAATSVELENHGDVVNEQTTGTLNTYNSTETNTSTNIKKPL